MDSIRRLHTKRLGQLAKMLIVCAALATTAVAQTAESGLGPGDEIRITVFRNPDLTTETRVSPSGTIVFPLIGAVDLAGRTAAEAGEIIADALREADFVRNPQVGVAILEIRSRRVSVLGDVARPGQYVLDGANQSLTDILALAGGITETGNDTVVIVTKRDGEPRRLEVDVPAMYRDGDLTGDIELVNGDTVFVPSAPVFYVDGAVQRAGAYPLAPGMSIRTALSLGGGLNERGTTRGIQIHRQMPDGTTRAIDAGLDDPVQANDVIHVKEGLF